MLTRAGGFAALVTVFVALIGCRRTPLDQPRGPGTPPADADADIPSNADAAAKIDAAADASGFDTDASGDDGAIVCLDAGTVVRNPTAVPVSGDFCGGQVDVAGTSALGPFVADLALVSVGVYDCHGDITVALYTGAVPAPGYRPAGLTMFVDLKYDGTRRTLVGTSTVTGYIESSDGSTSISFPTTVDVSAADDPYAGGDLPSMTPPPGQIRITIDADTGCNHITGTVVAPYCDWTLCI